MINDKRNRGKTERVIIGPVFADNDLFWKSLLAIKITVYVCVRLPLGSNVREHEKRRDERVRER